MTPGHPFSSLRVAVVEDDVVLRETLLELLGELGVGVAFHSATAVDAMVHFRVKEVDVAFLDLGLPDFDGADMARLLKTKQPNLKLVATTGDVRPVRHAEARKAGFDQVLVKPISTDDVESTLHRLFGLPAGQRRSSPLQ